MSGRQRTGCGVRTDLLAIDCDRAGRTASTRSYGCCQGIGADQTGASESLRPWQRYVWELGLTGVEVVQGVVGDCCGPSACDGVDDRVLRCVRPVDRHSRHTEDRCTTPNSQGENNEHPEPHSRIYLLLLFYVARIAGLGCEAGLGWWRIANLRWIHRLWRIARLRWIHGLWGIPPAIRRLPPSRTLGTICTDWLRCSVLGRLRRIPLSV